eukprot:TRINITY_DN4056_c1_g2_i2.p1 TRINITY_DN4056_c1_g2~~TRINITY_DN4056_c1_g2_i2.p1  ORF type:complete len:649 (+),score=106.36 TRINITY_DN4056_c1_g2_i2:237-2183(+)
MASPVRVAKHRKVPSFSTSPPIEKYIKETTRLDVMEEGGQVTWTDTPFKTHVGPYRLIKRIGKGSGGEVFLGRNSDTRDEVAIKIVRKSPRRPQVERMVRQEYRVMQYLDQSHKANNNNLVKHLETMENEREIAIIMQHAKSGDLFDFVNRRGALPEAEAWRLFSQLMHAVSYVHGKYICHRDIKPCNIFLDKSRNVLLGDWGHARTWNSYDKTSENCGSLCYAAPEVLVGDKNYVGPELDLWSCGTVLYVMLSGKRPFWTHNEADMHHNIRQGRYEELPSHISVQASSLLSMLLSPDPLKRATTMDVLNHPWMTDPPARHKRALSMPCLTLPKPQAPHPALRARREMTTYRTTIELAKWREQKVIMHVPDKGEIAKYFRSSHTVPDLPLISGNNASGTTSIENPQTSPKQAVVGTHIRALSGGDLTTLAHSIGCSGVSCGLSPTSSSSSSDFETSPVYASVSTTYCTSGINTTLSPDLASFTKTVSGLTRGGCMNISSSRCTNEWIVLPTHTQSPTTVTAGTTPTSSALMSCDGPFGEGEALVVAHHLPILVPTSTTASQPTSHTFSKSAPSTPKTANLPTTLILATPFALPTNLQPQNTDMRNACSPRLRAPRRSTFANPTSTIAFTPIPPTITTATTSPISITQH